MLILNLHLVLVGILALVLVHLVEMEEPILSTLMVDMVEQDIMVDMVEVAVLLLS